MYMYTSSWVAVTCKATCRYYPYVYVTSTEMQLPHWLWLLKHQLLMILWTLCQVHYWRYMYCPRLMELSCYIYMNTDGMRNTRSMEQSTTKGAKHLVWEFNAVSEGVQLLSPSLAWCLLFSMTSVLRTNRGYTNRTCQSLGLLWSEQIESVNPCPQQLKRVKLLVIIYSHTQSWHKLTCKCLSQYRI